MGSAREASRSLSGQVLPKEPIQPMCADSHYLTGPEGLCLLCDKERSMVPHFSWKGLWGKEAAGTLSALQQLHPLHS